MKVSSVSPDLWDTMVPHPFFLASRWALMLSDRADLVDLEEEAVAGLLVDGRLDASGVGDGQVVSDDLDLRGRSHARPVGPVVLVEGILNGDNGEALAEVEVE